MKNVFIVGTKYRAAQNISRFALANGNAPIYYEKLVYIGSEKDKIIEHKFDYHGEVKWFDDYFINTGRAEDNSMVFAELKN